MGKSLKKQKLGRLRRKWEHNFRSLYVCHDVVTHCRKFNSMGVGRIPVA
jgi:hypothetical protein